MHINSTAASSALDQTRSQLQSTVKDALKNCCSFPLPDNYLTNKGKKQLKLSLCISDLNDVLLMSSAILTWDVVEKQAPDTLGFCNYNLGFLEDKEALGKYRDAAIHDQTENGELQWFCCISNGLFEGIRESCKSLDMWKIAHYHKVIMIISNDRMREQVYSF